MHHIIRCVSFIMHLNTNTHTVEERRNRCRVMTKISDKLEALGQLAFHHSQRIITQLKDA